MGSRRRPKLENGSRKRSSSAAKQQKARCLFIGALLRLTWSPSFGCGLGVLPKESTHASRVIPAPGKAGPVAIIAAITAGGEWPCGEGHAPKGKRQFS